MLYDAPLVVVLRPTHPLAGEFPALNELSLQREIRILGVPDDLVGSEPWPPAGTRGAYASDHPGWNLLWQRRQ